MAVGWFYLSALALFSLGSMCILSTIYWMRYWHKGFAWDGTILTFNWHPVLMVTGMVVLYSAASLAYRLPQSWVGPKLPWKLGHAAMHLMAFILTVLGLAAVFNFHNHEKIPNLYSLHSWLGITTVFLFACQWFLGFVVFLLPWASVRLRSLLKPIHVFFGASILSLAIASVISGINEKLFFSLKNGTTSYSNLPDEAVFANSAGMLVVVFGLLVLYILQASSWKRPEPGLQAERQVRRPPWVALLLLWSPSSPSGREAGRTRVRMVEGEGPRAELLRREAEGPLLPLPRVYTRALLAAATAGAWIPAFPCD
uniref:Lysosomal membrane ascorbate-dependent ferrireductase CYB561A3 n=1 Tax=Sus scrofa TaxID=9823 RepID=A0A8D0MWQ5_PIG